MSQPFQHGGQHGQITPTSGGGDRLGVAAQSGTLSPLLGLHSHTHSGHGGAVGNQTSGLTHNPTPQGSISWTSALRELDWSQALAGLRFTPNVLFIFLFLAMMLWLFVVYFIRHHEPMANQVLGTGAVNSVTARADRQIVAGMRTAVPIRTGSSTGVVYVPNTGLDSLPYDRRDSAISADLTSGGSVSAMPVRSQMLSAPPLSSQVSRRSQPAGHVPSSAAAYGVPVFSGEYTRLKTFVNR